MDEDTLARYVGYFLRTCPGLSKVTIGELLGDPDKFFLKVGLHSTDKSFAAGSAPPAMAHAHSQMQGCAGAHLHVVLECAQRGGAKQKASCNRTQTTLRGCGRRTSSFAQQPVQHLPCAVPCAAPRCAPHRSWRSSHRRLTLTGCRLTRGCASSWSPSSCQERRRRSTASSTVSGHKLLCACVWQHPQSAAGRGGCTFPACQRLASFCLVAVLFRHQHRHLVFIPRPG